MNGYRDGYENRMSPADNDWNAFRRGQEKAQADRDLDTILRKNAEAQAQFSEGMIKTASDPNFGWGLLGLLLFAVVATGVAHFYFGFMSVVNSWVNAPTVEERAAAAAQHERFAALITQSQMISAAEAAALVNRFTRQDSCHRTEVALRFKGNGGSGGCEGGTIRGTIGATNMVIDGSTLLPATERGKAAVEVRVVPLAGRKPSPLGVRGLESEDATAVFMLFDGPKSIHAIPPAQRQGCAAVYTLLRSNLPVPKYDPSGTVASRPRLGCLEGGLVRYLN